jgi:hypothetical protein
VAGADERISTGEACLPVRDDYQYASHARRRYNGTRLALNLPRERECRARSSARREGGSRTASSLRARLVRTISIQRFRAVAYRHTPRARGAPPWRDVSRPFLPENESRQPQ